MSSYKSLSDAREQAVRTQLMLELTALREYYDHLTKSNKVTDHLYDLPSTTIVNKDDRSTNSQNKKYEWEEHVQRETLGQSDRDAIEAFFNVDDDFTKEFNSGFGQIKRSVL